MKIPVLWVFCMHSGSYLFYELLQKYYPETYSKLKKSNKTSQELFKIIQENKTLDILKRYKNIKKENKFSFAYFSYLIFEYSKYILDFLKENIPDIAKNENLLNMLNYIIKNADKKIKIG